MKFIRNCLIIGLFAAFMFLLLVLSYSFFLPGISLYAIVLATALVFIIFELGILTGILIIKIGQISNK